MKSGGGMVNFLIKGIFIGLLFGIPIGAVGTMTVQRTLMYGAKSGLLTGLGSSAADCLYACVGAFGITLISDLLLKYQTVINIAGGTFILIMGLSLLFRRSESIAGASEERSVSHIKMFLSSFAVGITNPAAILTFLFAFSYFGIMGQTGIKNGVCLVMGVFIGTYIWWCSLTAAVCFIKKKNADREFTFANKIFGGILIIFSAAVFVKTFI